MYAIVDIETTGSYAAANGITEIAIYVFDGEKVVDKFETLINPCQPIPGYIQAMTGISDEMVENAPVFEKVADKVHQLLQDKIFVAHNVNFDYSFIKSQLNYCGFDFNTKKLCTVRLSRKIFPGLPSYSLGNLCRSLNIEMNNHHRAAADAQATVTLFNLILQNDKQEHIQKSLLRSSKEQVLPPNVPKEHFDRLPYTPGVYYFHNEKGKVVYVGKAKNIRYRVNSHFSNNSGSRQKQNFLRHVHAISFQPCGTELMAAIFESTEIKKLWPVFNYSQKRWEDVYGIFAYEDQNGYLRLAIEKNKKRLKPVYTFHYLADGHSILRKLIETFHLCPRLCFMQKSGEPCGEECSGACRKEEHPGQYNERVNEAIASLHDNHSYAIMDKGLGADDQSCILVLNGKFAGMGYLPSDIQINSVEELEDYIKPYKENNLIHNMINGYAARFPSKVKSLDHALTINANSYFFNYQHSAFRL
jgi:DNA polymerase-3 subunit epsilon